MAISWSALVRPSWQSTRNRTRSARRHRQFDLVVDVFGELVGVDEAVAAGVDELDPVVVDLQRHGDAVAGDAGHVLDDADALAGQRVEEAALADVGPADDGDNGETIRECGFH